MTKILLCGLTAAVLVWFWPDAVLYLACIIGGILALAMLYGVVVLINEQPLLAAALLLLWREGRDDRD